MSLQPHINPPARVRSAPLAYSDLFRRFLIWDAANPHFYPMFERFALEAHGLGRRRIGVALVWERIRWESLLRTQGEAWKLNNDYRALYARRFMNDHPEARGLFEVRLQLALFTWEASLLRSPLPALETTP